MCPPMKFARWESRDRDLGLARIVVGQAEEWCDRVRHFDFSHVIGNDNS